MAHIAIFVGSISQSGSNVTFSGEARVSTMSASDDPLAWTAAVAFTAQTATVNAAIQAAAIAAAEAAEYTIGELDNKIIVAGGVGL